MGVRHRPGGRRRRPGCLLRAEREYPHSGQSVRVHAHGGDLRRLPASRRVRVGEATNSGFPSRAGRRPALPEAVECQLRGARGALLGLGGAKIAGAESNGRVFIKPRSGGECERPAGEWNCAEIVCVGDHIAVCVNGVLQNECTGSVRSGYIALQSEGGPVEFRNIWLTRLRRGI